jgi:hypothetical protein
MFLYSVVTGKSIPQYREIDEYEKVAFEPELLNN